MNFRFWDHRNGLLMADLVKVFGCRQAYENLHHPGRSDEVGRFSKADLIWAV